MQKRKIVEYETKRIYILKVAQKLFLENGVDEIKMEDIAKASQYTRKTLYTYFKSRDEVCLLVLINDTENRWLLQQGAIKNGKTGIEKLTIWAKTLYKYYKDNLNSLQLQKFWDYKGVEERKIDNEILEKFKEVNEELAEGLRNIFSIGQKDGTIRKDLNIDMCLSHFLYSYRSIIYRALSPGYTFARFEPDKYVESFLKFFKYSIIDNKGD